MDYLKHKMFHINFKVETLQSSITCDHCHSLITPGEILIIQNPSFPHYLHLSCFTPNPQPIPKNSIPHSLSSPNLQIYSSWLQVHNSHFPPFSSHSYPTLHTLSKIPSNEVRPYLEIFKFLDIKDLTQAIFFVNKKFYCISWNEELWKFLVWRDFAVEQVGEAKERYVREFYERCYECGKVPEKEGLYRCPLFFKTFCLECLKKEKYRLVRQEEFRRRFGIEMGMVQVKIWGDGLDRITYEEVALKAVQKFRQSNKIKVLEILLVLGSDHPFFKAIESVQILKLDQFVFRKGIEIDGEKKCNSKMKLKYKIFGMIRTGKGIERESILDDLRRVLKDF